MRRAILTLALAAVSGCGRPPAGHNVADDRADAEARRVEVARCSSDPATAAAPDCLAGLKAAGEAESRRALVYRPPASRLKNAGNL